MKPKPAVLISLLLLLVLLVFSFVFKLSSIPIRIWDEARLANNALQMYANGNYWVTFYEDAPDMWNTKPPLMIWLQVLGMKLLGVNEWAIRLPAALTSILTGLALWFFCTKQLNRPWLGFLTGSVLASTYAYAYNHAGRTGDYDALLVLFTTLYSLCIYRYADSGTNRWLNFFWGFLTLAVITKGIAGLLLLPGLALFLLLQESIKPLLRNKAVYRGAFCFLAIILGYYLIRENYNPGYLRAVYQNELGGRYLSTLENHRHPFWYYLNNLRTWRYLYWFYFLIPAFGIGFFHREENIRRLTLFNTSVVLPYLLIISASQTKLDWYDLPLFPFFALQIALLLYFSFQSLQTEFTGLKAAVKTATAAMLFALLFFLPFKSIYYHIADFREEPWDVEPHKQGYFLQQAIKQNKNLNQYVFCYEGYNGQIAFYIRKLQLEKMDVHLTNYTEGLPPGRHVVVSQPAMEQQLLGSYAVKKIGEQFGCTEYIVLSRL